MAGCSLLGCCGSPLLAVYLGLFGAAFLPAAKPLIFGLTVLWVAGASRWLRRKSAAGESRPLPLPSGDPLDRA